MLRSQTALVIGDGNLPDWLGAGLLSIEPAGLRVAGGRVGGVNFGGAIPPCPRYPVGSVLVIGGALV